MANDIVSCPSCSKKFRIPEGADSGEFPCTACGAMVPYGRTAAVAATGGGRKSRRGAKAAKAEKPARGGRKGRKAGRAKSAARGRRGDDRGELTPTKKDDNTLPIVAAILGGLVILGLVAMMLAGKDDPPPATTTATTDGTTDTADSSGGLSSGSGGLSAGDGTGDTSDTGSGGTSQPSGSSPSGTDTTSTPSSTDPAGTTEPTPPKPTGEPSGIGGSEVTGDEEEHEKDYGQWYRSDNEVLFIVHEDVEGVDASERAEIDALVATAVDFHSGMDGNRAQAKVEELGRKAIPAILTVFKGQTWESREEQYAAFKAQRMLRTIVKAEEPPSPLVARFLGRELNDPQVFYRAAKMWIAWWLGDLRHKESFAEFED